MPLKSTVPGGHRTAMQTTTSTQHQMHTHADQYRLSTSLLVTLFTLFAATVSSFAGEAEIQQLGNAINAKLANTGVSVRLAKLETYGTAESEAGNIIYFDDRAFKTGMNYVPRDPRRTWSGDQSKWQDDITYLIDGVDNQTHNGLDAIPAIRRAMTTWDDVTTTRIPLTDLGVTLDDIGYLQSITTDGTSGFRGILADITFGGFLPATWFEAVLGPGAGGGVLGVTATFTFRTDIDGDGQVDTAFAETYFNNNPAFRWAIDGVWVLGGAAPRDYDIQTIALHEAGHALSQNHFGKYFRTVAGGPRHFAPYAVMNAAYTRVHQTLTGTDIAGHSQLWASWPNR